MYSNYYLLTHFDACFTAAPTSAAVAVKGFRPTLDFEWAAWELKTWTPLGGANWGGGGMGTQNMDPVGGRELGRGGISIVYPLLTA